MKKVTIFGHFGFGKNLANGQTIKTKIITQEIENQLGEDNVCKIDTHGGKKSLIKLLFKMPSILRKSRNIVIFPAHKGVRFFGPVLTFFNFFYKRKLFYVVIGGWLPSFLNGKKLLEKQLKKFDGIFVETKTMEKELCERGFKNVHIMLNCKKLNILSESELQSFFKKPYKLCTFSRVSEKKGIGDAVKAVRAVNERCGEIAYTLEIYGQVDAGQEQWFHEQQANFPEYITYGGVIPFAESVEKLKDKFALLFPTKYYTEGIPGTIIDAYASGVPIIGARWQNYDDVIKDGVTGLGYTFEKQAELEEILFRLATDNSSFIALRKNCLKAVESFDVSNAIQILINKFE